MVIFNIIGASIVINTPRKDAVALLDTTFYYTGVPDYKDVLYIKEIQGHLV